jgi:hypothetical protein
VGDLNTRPKQRQKMMSTKKSPVHQKVTAL